MRSSRRSAGADTAGVDAYEVLGLDETASDAQVREAWSSRITRLDPSKDGAALTELNSAAETLLAADRRSALDARRAEERAAEDAARAAESDRPVAMTPTSSSTGGRRLMGSAAGIVVLVLLTVAATLAIVFAVVLGQQAEDADALQAGWTEAPASAASAAEAVLGYDYRDLDAGVSSARQLLTPTYRREYDAQLRRLRGPAVAEKVVVDAQVYASGVIQLTPAQDDNPAEASVLLFVDQTRSVAGSEELPVSNRVRFDMVQVDGRWLVDDIVTLDDF